MTVAPDRDWPALTRDVYRKLQTYEIVGASACAAAIVEALGEVARVAGDVHAEVTAAGARFCALKPDTASYANAVGLLTKGLERLPRDRAAALVAERTLAFAVYRDASVEAIAAEGARLLEDGATVLVHDYSSTVLAVLEKAGRRGPPLRVVVTSGQPLDKGVRVVAAVARFGHRVVYIPDPAIGRALAEVDVVLSGVETLFRDGDLANTVGTYPIALVAREWGVPVYGVTERLKIHPTLRTTTARELTARLLRPWPADDVILPDRTEVRAEVLDLTPAALVRAYVTERGLLVPAAAGAALDALYAEL